MKNIVIAGASKGVGKELVNHFKSENVLALARSFDSDNTQESNIKYQKCDLTDFEDVKSVITKNLILSQNCSALLTYSLKT